MQGADEEAADEEDEEANEEAADDEDEGGEEEAADEEDEGDDEEAADDEDDEEEEADDEEPATTPKRAKVGGWVGVCVKCSRFPISDVWRCVVV